MRKKLFTFLLALATSVGLSYAAVDGKLPGAFTINADGDQVYFSQGNLQYVGGSWQFATNQWDVIGASQTNSNRDLFGWGTGNNPNQTSDEYEDYTTFADWGSNMGGDWRTLTRDEWLYIYNTRTSASDLRGSATVCGVHGYIILPDNFVLPSGLSWTPRPNDWTTNVYTSQEWSSMEENGAVFLPAAGYREGTTVHYDGSAWGYYWSATEHPQAYYAYCAWVADEDSYVRVYYRDRTYGHSVRLVSETTPGGGSASAVTAARFVYNYDCQRNPAYPKKETACTLSGFKDPLEGYKGTKNGNIALGPWKLEFVAYYTPSNNYGCASQVNTAVYQYYSNLSSQEREAKKLEMPIFRLWQYNLTAREFQPAAYGIVCAYAGEANAQDHGALFISSGSWGCFLSGHQHTTSFALTCENDLTTGLAALVDAASASDPYYDVVWPVIVSIDAIGPVELSEHCKYYIEGSRAAYDALTDEQKAQVTNYSTLTNAETQWAALAAVAQPYADAVIDLINAIPNPVVYTQECKDAIDAAQAAYDALTDGQKVLVTNAETLLQAPIAFINVAHPNILFTANSNEKRIEDVTLPKSFTAGYFSTDNEFLGILKELYGINENAYINFIYSNNDAVTRSGNNLTVNPFSGTATVSGNIVIMSTSSDSPYSVNITLELPPFGPAPAPTDEQVPTNTDPQNPSYHYSTFFHSTQNYKLTNDGTQAFIADLSGSDLVLTEIANGTQVIPANTAVILRKTGSADPVVLTPTEENGVSVNPDENSLEGVDDATLVTDITGLTLANCYVLSGTDQYGVGFYRINGNTLKAHKAYVKYVSNPGQNNAPKKMRFVFNTATGVESAQPSVISGQKLIENGQLIIIKNGVRYNAQGQIVK